MFIECDWGFNHHNCTNSTNTKPTIKVNSIYYTYNATAAAVIAILASYIHNKYPCKYTGVFRLISGLSCSVFQRAMLHR